MAQWHVWAKCFPGQGGPGFVRVGLQQHTDQWICIEGQGKGVSLLVTVTGSSDLTGLLTHRCSILQSSTQSPAWPVSHVMDSRGQMRVALRFLPQTSQSELIQSPVLSQLPFQICYYAVWLHSQAKGRQGWKLVRCKFGWKTARISLQSEDWLSIPLWSGNIGHWCVLVIIFSHVCWNQWTHPSMFCCSTVLPDTSRKSRQKTRVVKRTANPMFNHTMVYDGFRPEDLKEACVEITVWDHDRLNNHYIGGLRLGLGTGGFPLYW